MPSFFTCAVFLSFFALSVKGACTNPRQRKEWRALNALEQQAYIDAVLCLQNNAAQTSIPGVQTRFDDFQATHIKQNDIIHHVGQFLPWHRLFVWAYENALRDECGYTGAQPWWDESLDAGHYITSPLFTEDAFGGDGDPNNNNCITTGPFASYTLHLGPNDEVNDHCLTRNMALQSSVVQSMRGGADVVQSCLGRQTFTDANRCIEDGGPHFAGHVGVNGEMANTISSPGDPLFYMHHSFIDKIWWDWQALNLSTRLTEISGRTTYSSAYPPYALTTLDYVMSLNGIEPDTTIRDVMNIKGEILCYEYV